MTTEQQRKTASRDIDADLGRRAHMLMWDAKRTQASVAAQMGIGSDSLGRKLKGERGWALAEIASLASALNTSIAYLAGETENPRPGGPDGDSRGVVHPLGLEPRTHWIRDNVVSLNEARMRRTAHIEPSFPMRELWGN